jgi:hypothetical protein
MQAAITTARAGVASPAAEPPATSAPAGVSSVWVRLGRQAGWMVRGDVNAPGTDAVSHWYSADGAVLRLDAGLLVGFTEASRSWRTVSSLPAVDWHAVAQGQSRRFDRLVDEQPGYRLGLRHARELRLSEAGPAGQDGPAPTGASARWFVERSVDGALPPFWYRVDLTVQPPRVLQGDACLGAGWCLSWRPSPGTELR